MLSLFWLSKCWAFSASKCWVCSDSINVEHFLPLNAEFVLTLDEERFLTPNSKCALYLDTIRVSSNLLSQSTIPLSRTLSFTVLQSICVSLNPHVFLVSHHALCVLWTTNNSPSTLGLTIYKFLSNQPTVNMVFQFVLFVEGGVLIAAGHWSFLSP